MTVCAFWARKRIRQKSSNAVENANAQNQLNAGQYPAEHELLFGAEVWRVFALQHGVYSPQVPAFLLEINKRLSRQANKILLSAARDRT